jgi:hypothetical protein
VPGVQPMSRAIAREPTPDAVSNANRARSRMRASLLRDPARSLELFPFLDGQGDRGSPRESLSFSLRITTRASAIVGSCVGAGQGPVGMLETQVLRAGNFQGSAPTWWHGSPSRRPSGGDRQSRRWCLDIEAEGIVGPDAGAAPPGSRFPARHGQHEIGADPRVKPEGMGAEGWPAGLAGRSPKWWSHFREANR